MGLDPIQIIEIRELIRELGKQHTVIFSSHILSEVQTICDQVLIIANGKLAAFDRPEALEKRLLSSNEILVVPDGSTKEAMAILESLPHITHIQAEEEGVHPTLRIRTDVGDLYDLSRAIFLAFAQAKKPLLELRLEKASLEQVFLQLTESVQEASPQEAGDGTKQKEAKPI